MKYLIWTAAIIFLFASCPDNTEEPYNELAANGQGGFTLRLGNTTERAILPATPDLNQFAVFELDFSPSSGGFAHNVKFAQTSISSGALPVVILAAGSYNLTVNAYLGGTSDAPARLAASGNAAITINTGAEITENVRLKALLEGTVQGNFNWSANITAAGITSAVMTITGVTAGASEVNPVNLSNGGNSGSPALNPGMYNVNFKLAKEAGSPLQKFEAEWNELLYVYSSLVSGFNITFDDSFFHRIQYNVTFQFNDTVHFYDPNALTSAKTGVQSVLHAGVIGTLGSLDAVTSRGYRFDGWYRNADFSGAAWNLSSGAVMEDMTLYAKWTPNNITITLIDIDNIPAALGVTFNPVVTPAITLSRTGTGYPTSQAITVIGLNTGDSFGWSIKGKGVSASETVQGTTSPVTISATNVIYNSLGWHTVELNIVKSGIQYRTSFVFQIIQ
ncbi:MAG: InlB B-repeat-containing protein [Treponema sp.]|nr:InlB B-repeat-containing protein [Treponema sp.]